MGLICSILFPTQNYNAIKVPSVGPLNNALPLKSTSLHVVVVYNILLFGTKYLTGGKDHFRLSKSYLGMIFYQILVETFKKFF